MRPTDETDRTDTDLSPHVEQARRGARHRAVAAAADGRAAEHRLDLDALAVDAAPPQQRAARLAHELDLARAAEHERPLLRADEERAEDL